MAEPGPGRAGNEPRYSGADFRLVPDPPSDTNHLTVPAAGTLELTRQLLQFEPLQVPTWLIQASAAFSIKVRLHVALPWAPYQILDHGTTVDNAAGANEIIVVRGRWDALQVVAAENTKVWVRADLTAIGWS